jgi:hypothetical protein
LKERDGEIEGIYPDEQIDESREGGIEKEYT